MSRLRLLLVEDNPADARLVMEAMREAEVDDVDITHCTDGERALEHLRSSADAIDAVVLDLNMPRLDGRAFLRELRRDPRISEMFVVVLTTSHYEQDLLECRALSARGIVLKPTDFDAMVAIVVDIVQMCREAAPGISRAVPLTPD